MKPDAAPHRPNSRVHQNRPSAGPVPARLHVARITGPSLKRLDRQFCVVRGFLRRVARHNPPVHAPAAGREHGVHVEYSPEVPRIRQSERADRDVRLDRRPVVVVAGDFTDVAVGTPEQQIAPVPTNDAGRMRVLKPHRPERFRGQLVHPVRVASACRSQVNMERRSVRVIAHRHNGRRDDDGLQFVGNHIGQRLQARTVHLHLI